MPKKDGIAIAIDGPAAAGKSTVAKMIADKLSIVYIDTGAMYRALTLKALLEKINAEDETALINLLKRTKITFIHNKTKQCVLLDEEDVTEAIRSEEVSNTVSVVAKHPQVRKEMVRRQQEMAKQHSVIMDGRDIGTHVLPNAQKKFFLHASVEERAKRRFEEIRKQGSNTTLEQLQTEIKERDERDMNRKTSPLKRAEDAIVIDTTSLSIEEVVERIYDEVKHLCKN